MGAFPVPEIPGYLVSRMALADAAEWTEFAVLPEVRQFTSSSIAGIDDVIPMIQRSLSEDSNAPVLFAVRHAATNQLAASIGFHTISALNRTAEITYVLRPEQWGKGLGTLACDAAVQWGFRQRGWVRIQATVLEQNLASVRILEKCGFAFEGRLRNYRIVRGQPMDFLLYARIPSSGEVGPT